MKTIKQLADELGVSKTYVRKHMDDDFRLQHTKTTGNGVITIDPEGCKLLSETIGNRTENTENKVAETPANTVNPLYDILKAELDAKNRQIEQLQNDLAEERKHSREQADKLALLADQAQQLHAGDMRRLSPVAMPGAEFESVEAFEEEEGQKPVQEPSDAQNGLLEALRGISWGEIIKAKFGRKKGEE